MNDFHPPVVFSFETGLTRPATEEEVKQYYAASAEVRLYTLECPEGCVRRVYGQPSILKDDSWAS